VRGSAVRASARTVRGRTVARLSAKKASRSWWPFDARVELSPRGSGPRTRDGSDANARALESSVGHGMRRKKTHVVSLPGLVQRELGLGGGHADGLGAGFPHGPTRPSAAFGFGPEAIEIERLDVTDRRDQSPIDRGRS